jgi:hypothetical protein
MTGIRSSYREPMREFVTRLRDAAASPLKRENSMTRTLIIATASAAALFSSSAVTQERSQGTASIPDFSGIWGNPYLYGIEPPVSGPGPVVNKHGGDKLLTSMAGPYRLRTPRS